VNDDFVVVGREEHGLGACGEMGCELRAERYPCRVLWRELKVATPRLIEAHIVDRILKTRRLDCPSTAHERRKRKSEEEWKRRRKARVL
jgi:hypothetical protein